ncbi:DUF5412 domain-containing protein [Alkalihalobacillus sp. AL-G]|uniref:DUF5412 domain-containing protein n=1 Tax=Alkalihalobacillus sp. AL-G TaxID=2926399 RepID=UPI00351B1A33
MDVNYEKKKIHKRVLRFLTIGSLLIVGLITYAVYWSFFDMARLPAGEFLTEETSPDGRYTLKAYVTNGGATASYSVRGELVFNQVVDKSKTIYWNYRENKASISWKDNNTVEINGHKLDVPHEEYDFRHDN